MELFELNIYLPKNRMLLSKTILSFVYCVTRGLTRDLINYIVLHFFRPVICFFLFVVYMILFNFLIFL